VSVGCRSLPEVNGRSMSFARDGTSVTMRHASPRSECVLFADTRTLFFPGNSRSRISRVSDAVHCSVRRRAPDWDRAIYSVSEET
jgi:hypothetical protein